jgi:choline dehydrogenase
VDEVRGSNGHGDRTRSEYQYVVVGAGTAGSVVAARLSESGSSVLLVEAGSADRPDDSETMPTAWGGRFDWAFTSTPQTGLRGVTVPVPRGRGLGGSSSINGTFHIRGHFSSYDAWTQAGANGWDYHSMLPFFRRSERTTDMDPVWRGTDGPMLIEPPTVSSLDLFQRAAWEAAAESGYRLLRDGNGEETEGAALTELNVVQGARQSAADAYLRPALGRHNLKVFTDALVRRLMIERGRCVGVEYQVDGRSTTVKATSEVALCAGAIGSAQILLLSGVGPADHLRQVGVPLIHDLSGVGANLHDHPFAHVDFLASEPIDVTNPSAIHILTRSSAKVDPDLQLMVAPVPLALRSAEDTAETWGSKSYRMAELPGYSVAFSLMRPVSTGTVRLSDADPTSTPQIDLGYYRDSQDLDRMAEGLRLATHLGSSDAFDAWRPPGPAKTTAPLADPHAYIRLATSSYFHLSGTCAAGTGPQAVVDPELRVHGLQGLRVVDASAMPSQPSANTNATVLALAERAAVLLLG